ncbi:MAG: L,D-transpeptidase family protein [Alphaproteobacteria bacterium]|nr:L,D-transpeptidase family protein [Alphaproteobacteria bacterium]
MLIPWLPGGGTELTIPTWDLIPDGPRDGVLINLPEMRVYVFLKDKNKPQTFPIAIGREGLETPYGTTSIVRKAADPIWRPTPRMRSEDPNLPAQVGPGPENPMGTHALYLGWAGYAMHGTNKPYAIGRRASSGCIRMYPEDIVTMFDMLPVGTKVTTVNQPIKLAWIDNVLYLQAHPDIDQAIQMEETGQVYLSKLDEKELQW